jgi:small subunit ribosomal protein S20
MPTTKSAKKRLRQSEEQRQRNRSTKSALRTQIRKVLAAVEASDKAKADEEYRLAAKRLDKAAAKKVIHPNKASRLKSRLQHAMKKGKQAAAK